jgi:hypothetical protein
MKTLDHRFRSGKADGPDATQVQPSNWNDGHVFTGGATGQTLVRDTSDATYGATWMPHGVWTDIPFSPGLFHGSGGMTWTVTAVDLLAYMVIGGTCFVAFGISAGTLAGTASGAIFFDLPAPVPQPIAGEISLFRLSITGGGWVPGVIYMSPGSRAVNLAKIDTSAFPLGPVAVQGQIFFRAT